MSKIKILIPKQSLKVEIPEQEIEMDFQPIWEVDPPTDKPTNPPVTVEPPTVSVPPINVGREVVDISESFAGKNDIKLEGGKTYKIGLIKSQMLFNRDVKIYCDDEQNRPILEVGVENYRPAIHGKQDGFLFMMHDNSSLLIKNVDVCQKKTNING